MIQCVSKYVLYEIFNIKIRNPEEVGRYRQNTLNHDIIFKKNKVTLHIKRPK